MPVVAHPPLQQFLANHWFIYPWLTGGQLEVVLRFAETFCDKAEFYASPGVDRVQELAWLVGANAALVGGAQRTNCFATVRWVYLLGDGALEELSGDAFGHSTVRLNAHDLWEESLQRIPGRQVAVHEFAHVLDDMFGISGSTPALREGMELHLDNRRRGVDDIFPDEVYETLVVEDSSHEFFSYLSEVFFTDPHGVLDFYPPLYEDLVAIYGLDLARQLPDLAEEG